MNDFRLIEQEKIRLGTHGENYGSWMSTPVFFMIGGGALLALALAVGSLVWLHVVVLAALFGLVAMALMGLFGLCLWIRRQYAADGGGLMEKVHAHVLANLDFDGQGTLLEVGCGSGALAIRAALTWPDARVIGIDSWAPVYFYSRAGCMKNADSEGVGMRCIFRQGDARKLDLPDESVDALVSNYVYHNIVGCDKQALLCESLRVLKKGGVFAINDSMRPNLYGDIEAFAQSLRDDGYEEVRIIDTTREVFGGPLRASLMMLAGSRMIVGRK